MLSEAPSSEEHSERGRSGGLLRSTAIFSGMTQLSRVLGLLRDILLARLFGATAATDAFFVAFKIPNFFRRLFAEGAFSQAFVPVLSEYKEQRSFNELQRLVARTSGTLATILFVITAIGVIAAPAVMAVFGYGFVRQHPETYQLATDLLRITFPYLFFISLTALAGGILNSYGRFAAPAFAPVLLNVSLIVCALWWAPHFAQPVEALAWGVLIAGVAQLLFQWPFIYRLGLLRWPRWGWRDSGVRRIMQLMVPALFGSAVVQINLLLDTVLASMLQEGSVSWLYYSDRLVEFPLGVFGVAVGTVILPALSQRHANANPEGFSHTLDWAWKLVVVISLPAMVGLIALAAPMLSTLFQYDEFGQRSVDMAAWSLMAYSLGLPAFILIKIFAPAFFSRQDTRTPVRIGVQAMAVNMLFNIVFVGAMVYWDFAAPHTGLALATSASAWLNAWWLYRVLRRDGVYQLEKGWLSLWLRTLLASGAMAGLLLYLSPADWSQGLWWQRALGLLALVGLGALVYALAQLLMGLRPRHLIERGDPPKPS
ncbi:MAG: murein biosynthesis integral membrane protein MurJ [Pseudomonadota bacterium]